MSKRVIITCDNQECKEVLLDIYEHANFQGLKVPFEVRVYDQIYHYCENCANKLFELT